jgi:hypothetical protein
MVDVDSHLKLLPTSLLVIYNKFEHIDMLLIGIQQQPYTVIPILVAQILGFWVHLSLVESSQHDAVITPWLRLTATSNCFPHPR